MLRRLSTCRSSLAIWIHIWLQHFMDKLYFNLKFQEFSWMDFHPIKGLIPIWGSKKRNKDFRILLGLVFINNICMEQIDVKKVRIQNKIIHVVVVFFLVPTYLCINIFTYKHKYRKCQNELLWTMKHVSRARKIEPNETLKKTS